MDFKVISLEGYEAIGMCPNEHIIWIYGFGENAEKWANLLIHKHFHAILHKFKIDSRFHHYVINIYLDQEIDYRNRNKRKSSKSFL